MAILYGATQQVGLRRRRPAHLFVLPPNSHEVFLGRLLGDAHLTCHRLERQPRRVQAQHLCLSGSKRGDRRAFEGLHSCRPLRIEVGLASRDDDHGLGQHGPLLMLADYSKGASSQALRQLTGMLHLGVDQHMPSTRHHPAHVLDRHGVIAQRQIEQDDVEVPLSQQTLETGVQGERAPLGEVSRKTVGDTRRDRRMVVDYSDDQARSAHGVSLPAAALATSRQCGGQRGHLPLATSTAARRRNRLPIGYVDASLLDPTAERFDNRWERTMTQLAPDVGDPTSAPDAELERSLAAMIAHDDFPCLGARSVFRRDNAVVQVYDELDSEQVTPDLLEDLASFTESVDPDGPFASFIAVFRSPIPATEREFEQLLWSQLQRLHAADDVAWNPDVSPNPTDDHFAFSVRGTAFFVVGLHPQASRVARRTVTPTLVFNLHAQFEALRASGAFERLRDKIRERDEQLQGTINPMVSDYGQGSEARQYSGRRVGADWVAPFELEES